MMMMMMMTCSWVSCCPRTWWLQWFFFQSCQLSTEAWLRAVCRVYATQLKVAIAKIQRPETEGHKPPTMVFVNTIHDNIYIYIHIVIYTWNVYIQQGEISNKTCHQWISNSHLAAGREEFIPAEMLRGLLPDALLERYKFWRHVGC